MTTNILDAYGEDGDWQYYNGNVGAGGVVIQTGYGFRSGYARCCVMFSSGLQTFGQRLWPGGPVTTAWFSMRMYLSGININHNLVNPKFIGFCDASGLERIAVIQSGTNSPLPNQYDVFKVDALGNTTLLFTTISGFSGAPSVPDKVDFFFDYSTTGTLSMYINGAQVGTYSGDITTDGITQLAGTYQGAASYSAGSYGYSECILADGDTRDLSVVTCYASGAGSTDQWTGAYTNVNTITVNDGVFDTTTTSGDVQLYTMTGITTGNFDILTLVTNIRATQGAGLLTHIALAQEISGTQYATSAKNFPTSFGPVQFIQELNPATGQLWTQSDVNAVGFQSGYKATT